MTKNKNSALTELSRTLRKNMTKEERHLWYDFLKNLPETVCRQKVVGRYILDFYCAAAKLAIELDGSQHYANNMIACAMNTYRSAEYAFCGIPICSCMRIFAAYAWIFSII